MNSYETLHSCLLSALDRLGEDIGLEDILDLAEAVLTGEEKERILEIKNAYSDYLRSTP